MLSRQDPHIQSRRTSFSFQIQDMQHNKIEYQRESNIYRHPRDNAMHCLIQPSRCSFSTLAQLQPLLCHTNHPAPCLTAKRCIDFLDLRHNSIIRALSLVVIIKQQWVLASAPRVLCHIQVSHLSTSQPTTPDHRTSKGEWKLTRSLTPHTVTPTHLLNCVHPLMTVT
jgi:hypothetical protein